MNLIKIRGIISSLLIVTFIIVTFTGIGLYFSPTGRIAKRFGWSFLGLTKWQLEQIHNIFGFLMVGLIIIHLIMNYKMYISEIKSLFK